MSNTRLIDAVKAGDVSAIRTLIAENADINESGNEQGWTALNFAAGLGNLEIVRLLVDSGADVFRTGKDKRTPYKIAIAASRIEVAKFLAAKEAMSGGDLDKISSREWEERPFCKAYYLKSLTKYPGWKDHRDNFKKVTAGSSNGHFESEENVEQSEIVYIHSDYSVTESIWIKENPVFEDVTPEWKRFCEEILEFRIPSDFDLAE